MKSNTIWQWNCPNVKKVGTLLIEYAKVNQARHLKSLSLSQSQFEIPIPSLSSWSPFFSSSDIINLNEKQFNLDLTIIVSIWRKHYEVVQFIVSSQPFIASTVYPQILSKYSIHGVLKGQKSMTRRFLSYCKSRSVIEGLCKYTFLIKVCGINPVPKVYRKVVRPPNVYDKFVRPP